MSPEASPQAVGAFEKLLNCWTKNKDTVFMVALTHRGVEIKKVFCRRINLRHAWLAGISEAPAAAPSSNAFGTQSLFALFIFSRPSFNVLTKRPLFSHAVLQSLPLRRNLLWERSTTKQNVPTSLKFLLDGLIVKYGYRHLKYGRFDNPTESLSWGHFGSFAQRCLMPFSLSLTSSLKRLDQKVVKRCKECTLMQLSHTVQISFESHSVTSLRLEKWDEEGGECPDRFLWLAPKTPVQQARALSQVHNSVPRDRRALILFGDNKIMNL